MPLLLLRHGQTAHNAERRFMGVTDIPLNEIGGSQAQQAAQLLVGNVAAVYSSPLSRAQQTAHPVGLPLTLVAELAELDQGELEGMAPAQALATFPDFFAAWRRDPFATRVPGGESLGECQARARAALDLVIQSHSPDEVVVVVTHQMVISALRCALEERALTDWRDCLVRNGSLTSVVGRRIARADVLPGEATLAELLAR
jgi:probable phosphoglycerate mutase